MRKSIFYIYFSSALSPASCISISWLITICLLYVHFVHVVLNNTPFVHARVYLQYLSSALPWVFRKCQMIFLCFVDTFVLLIEVEEVKGEKRGFLSVMGDQFVHQLLNESSLVD